MIQSVLVYLLLAYIVVRNYLHESLRQMGANYYDAALGCKWMLAIKMDDWHKWMQTIIKIHKLGI